MTERCEMEKLSLTYFNVKRASYGKISCFACDNKKNNMTCCGLHRKQVSANVESLSEFFHWKNYKVIRY